MKMKSLFLASFAMVFAGSLQAQSNQLILSGIQFQVIGAVQQSGSYTLADFQSFAGGSALLNTNFYGYEKKDLGMSADIGFGAQANFKWNAGGEVKKNRRIQLGLAGGMSTAGSLLYERQTRVTGDSIYDGAGTLLGHIDSTYHSTYDAQYSGNFLRLDASVLWSTDEERRFSFYTGGGLMLGGLFNAHTTVVNSEWVNASYVYQIGNTSSLGYHMRPDAQSESFSSKGGWYANLYLPLGVNLSLGKTHPFWSHANLYSEWRPSIVFQNYAQTGVKTVFGVGHTWGIRWEF